MSLERPVAPDPYALLPAVGSFTVSSPDVTHGGRVELTHVYGPDAPGGANQSPALSWSGFPEGTASFVVNCFDPDAPTPAGFWHWTVVDIPAAVTELAPLLTSRPRGLAQAAHPALGTLRDTDDTAAIRNAAATDFGTAGYDGPAPPPGDQVHRYFFVVHAVDVPTLGVDASASATVVAFNLVFHTLARAILVPEFAY